MNLYVQHDAHIVASLLNETAPNCEAVILKHGDPTSVLASTHAGNPLAADWLLDAESPGDLMIAWSGTLSHQLFDRDPRNWMDSGRRAFAALCDELAEQLVRHGRILCFRPHARHVLNDIPSCLGFLRDRALQRYAVALAPSLLFEPTMMGEMEDHLERHFEALGSACPLLMIEDLTVRVDTDGSARCDTVALGEGQLPRHLVRRLISDYLPASVPIVINGAQGTAAISRQIEWLCG